MRFEWDPEKDVTNIRKHGIAFETATRVFADPNLVLRNEPLTRHQLEILQSIAKRQLEEDDSEIDFSDVPELTDEQLAEFRRVEIDPETGKPVLPPRD